MPLRPDLPSGLNLTRRQTTPVKLPRMNFPMIGGVPESTGAAPEQATPAPPQPVQEAAPHQEEESAMEETRYVHMAGTMTPNPAPAVPMPPAQPAVPMKEAARVIVYGRSGSQACLEAVQDLLERGVCFTYHDVGRDLKARQHMQAIAGNDTMVPVIIHIGAGST